MTNQCEHGQLARVCPLCEKDERIRVLEHLVIDAAYTLDKARIWNGMGWTYSPLHPVHYTPMRERLHNECDSIEAARAALAAQPAPAAVPPCHVAVIGYRFDPVNQIHVPQVLLEFEPVPVNSPNDAKGWQDRDALAAMIAAAGDKP